MNSTMRKAPNLAFATDAGSCAESFGRRAFRAAMRAAHGFFERRERKPTYEIHLASGRSLRTVQAWFADKHQGSATALIALLATDAGPDVLRAIRAELEAAGRTVPDFYDDLELIGAVKAAQRSQKRNASQSQKLQARIKEL